MIRALVNGTIRLLLALIVRTRTPGLYRVPPRGPLIIAVNHINFLEVPLIYQLLRPRRIIGLAKIETWDNPALRVLANLWEAIPVRRGSADTRAFRRAAAELARGAIVVMAPEGTRSGDGRLRPAHAGVVALAAHTGAPILPMAHFGGELLGESWRRLRRPVVTVRVGSPIRVRPDLPGGRIALTRAEREAALLEVMTAIARLLPEEYRGVYGAAVSSVVVPAAGAPTAVASTAVVATASHSSSTAIAVSGLAPGPNSNCTMSPPAGS